MTEIFFSVNVIKTVLMIRIYPEKLVNYFTSCVNHCYNFCFLTIKILNSNIF
jgi:hypothetical protein